MSNLTTKEYFNQDGVKKKFNELLGKRSTQFITSVLQIVNSNKLLMSATPESIYNACTMAATLDLPINQNLGFAWIVPYRNAAQFQMGWKGFVQLAQRTGQYLRINVVEVYANQYKSFNS
jgi:recombination protein RecT